MAPKRTGRLSPAERGGTQRTYAADPGEIAGSTPSWSRPRWSGAGKEATLGRLRRAGRERRPRRPRWASSAARPARQSDGAEGRAAASRGRAGRAVWRAPPEDPGHPRRAGRGSMPGSAHERRALLRQFDGELARARAGEQALAGQARRAEGQGGAPRGRPAGARRSWSARSSSIGASTRPTCARASGEDRATAGRSRMRG